MDRRQQKTRAAIFGAFSRLLQKKRFENITVQEIIDEANVGRSTFYAHFETKNDLLRALCTQIFEHVFVHALPQEAVHAEGLANLQLKLGHILYHLGEHRSDLAGILPGEGGELFMQYLREYLTRLFEQYQSFFSPDVPQSYLMNHLTGSFAETLKWWLRSEKEYPPEKVAGFWMAVNC